MGVARSTVAAYLNDPDLANQRARRVAYAGRCSACGEPTDGSAGPGRAPALCQSCHNDRRREAKRARVVAAIRRYVELYGRPPCARDWNPADAAAHLSPERAREVAERYAAGNFPPANVAQKAFGSWNAAIAAAGFEPVPSGHRRANGRR